ncbi:MAG: Omp28 family outer membrane lipoprotein [Dysgonamonadaceae bacterium]|jgi:hypothetical protein|nr:Omp28 family outer membrane lipoprotein [Dysgonamonadaceae bacterium]
MIKKIFSLFIFVLVVTNNGCDVISESDRIVEMDEVIPLKKVLLLEFTDQDCINCLKAATEANKIKGYYGDNFVTVSVHASARRFPLRTPEGNEYENHFGIIFHPTGVIDGVSISSDFALWDGLVRDRFNVSSSLSMDLSLDYDTETRELIITSEMKGLKNISDAKLLFWIIENNVIDWQRISETEINYEYQHNHVFRAPVNGTWGEDFSIQYDEVKQLRHTYILKENWDKENISIIVFIYNIRSNEVFDVEEIQLENN